MIRIKNRSYATVVLLTGLLLTGCSRAPSFDVMGSFFPAWLACLAAGIVLAVLSHLLLVRLRIALAVPAVAYPCLTAVFAISLWLLFFR